MLKQLWTVASGFLLAAMTLAGGAMATTEKLAGTAWQLVAWTEQSLIKDTEITLAFEQGRLAGLAGCNRYTTGYKSDERTLSVQQAIASTMMACPEEIMSQESSFLQALAGVEQFAINAKGELQLFYRTEEGLGLLTFTPQKKP